MNDGQAKPPYVYEVALSYAGEDRAFVEATAKQLRERAIPVFYDQFETAKLWGTNLYEHLAAIYGKQARFTVMFLSRHYAEKAWTNHERAVAQARAFTEHCEYVLPVRFDDTEIPGVLPTTGYLDLRDKTPGYLVDMIEEKLRLASQLASAAVPGRQAGQSNPSEGRVLPGTGAATGGFTLNIGSQVANRITNAVQITIDKRKS
jgi:hypothetical protein